MPTNNEHYFASLALDEVKRVWNAEYCGLLPIPPPKLSFLSANHVASCSGLYYITVDECGTWQITLSFGEIGLSPEEFRRHVRVILRHEIGHFTLCPFDYLRQMRMILSVVRVFKAAGHKKPGKLPANLVNQVGDILVDTVNYGKHADETLADERYWFSLGRKKTPEGEGVSRLAEFMFAVKESLWGVSVGCHKDKLVQDEVGRMRRHFSDVLSKKRDEQRQIFPRLAAEYAKAWLELAKEEPLTLEAASVPVATPMPAMPGGEDDIRSFATECSIEDFLDVLACTEWMNEKEAQRVWYEEHAADWRNPFRVRAASEVLTAYPVRWRLGDPIDELDLALSLQCSPILLPGLTTQRWFRGGARSVGANPDIPDLLVVLDTSGSMQGEGESRLHIARLAIFSILRMYEKTVAMTAGVMFSSSYRVSGWCRDVRPLKDLVLSEFGDNTVFPIDAVERIMCETPRTKALVVVSDSELQNLQAAVQSFLRLLGMGHKVLLYIIKGEPFAASNYSGFQDAGGEIRMVNTADDLYADICDHLVVGLQEKDLLP